MLRGRSSQLEASRSVWPYAARHRYVRQWRIDNIGPLAEKIHASLHAPLWQVPYETLFTELENSQAHCVVSAVAADDGGIRTGDVFDRAFWDRLPDGIDAFGENGEFHTEVLLPDTPRGK